MQRHLLLLTGLFLAGCAGTPDEHIIPFNAEQKKVLLARARPPQAFGLTVYNTERGPHFAGAQRLHSDQMADMPFVHRADSGAPVISLASRSAKEIPALLDTASRENWIASRTALPLDIVMLAGPRPYETTAGHVHDEVGGTAGLLHRLKLYELHVENVVLYVRMATGPMGPPARWLQDPEPQVVLGMPFLRAFSFVSFDFPRRSVQFSATTPMPEPDEALVIAVMPLVDVRGAPGIEGSINGEPATLILDTGGDFDLAMSEPPGPSIRRLALGDLVFPPNVNVKASRDVGLGDAEFPRIGRGLLGRFRVTLDFRNKAAIFERP